MGESTKPPLPATSTIMNTAPRASAGKNARANRLKYALPIPLRTFPLPAFYPSNPISLLHLAFAWVSQLLYPPVAEPVVYHGVWSPETRSVHVTDPRSMDSLWSHGFFGKGSLSRSEPNWLKRQLGNTIEQHTVKRREDRASSKWERGRSELAAIEQRRREEAQAEGTESMPDPRISEEDTGCAHGSAGQRMPQEELALDSAAPFRAPVGPLELLALPNSQEDLILRQLERRKREIKDVHVNGGVPSVSNGHKEHLFCAPVGPLELLALPNSVADLQLLKQHTSASLELHQRQTDCNNSSSTMALQDIIINGAGARESGVVGSKALPESDESSCTDETQLCFKRQKSVRFAANVESTTFQHSDPPSPNHSMSMANLEALGDTPSLNGDARANVPPAAKEAANGQKEARSGETREVEAEKREIMNKEHLQLSPEEAFFLAYGLGALVVTDPQTQTPLTTAQLFLLCRQYSYFPPRDPTVTGAAAALSTDDPFLVHYAVYHHFRSLGWVPRHGIKFGVDWLLYGKGPALDHAEFGVMIMPSYTDPRWQEEDPKHQALLPRRSWHWLHSVNRVLSTVFKSFVLVYVDIPPPSVGASCTELGDGGASKLLQQYRIREVMVRRWSSNRNRD